MAELAICAVCAAPVVWRLSSAGNQIEMDPEPVGSGLWALLKDGSVTYRKDVPEHGGPFLQSHYASCPGKQAARAKGAE